VGLHNEELPSLLLLAKYCLGDQMKNKVVGTCRIYGGEERCIQVLVGKPEGESSLCKPRHTW
jgi:hypothetical protein